MSAHQFTFQFKLDDGNGLVHFPAQLFSRTLVIGSTLHFKNLAGIILITSMRKGSQRHAY